MGRRAAEMGEVEIGRQLVEAGERLDRLRRADPRQQRQQGHRLDALPRADARRRRSRAASTICPRRRPAAPRARIAAASRPSASNIWIWVALFETWSSPRTMWVIAEVDVVDDARQQIEPAAVLAPDDRIGQQFGVEPLLAADQVGPLDRRVMVEPEAPVRRRGPPAPARPPACARRPAAGRARAAPCGEGRALRRSRSRHRPGRPPSQPLEFALVEVEPLRLANHAGRAPARASRDRRGSPGRTRRSSARGRYRRSAG